MVTITLPDSTKKEYEQAVTVAEVAKSIGSGLYRATVAGNVDGKLVDASYQLTQDTSLKIITNKDKEALDIIRHSCAHLMAQAIKRLYPNAQITIGPVIEDGFYYDIAHSSTFTESDLDKIEQEMRKIAKENLTIERIAISRQDAIEKFGAMGETYKVSIINDLPEEEPLSIYQQGEFVDLCRGPHVQNTGKIKAFKLLKVAGAYWRGDSKNEMLQRIYGTAWHSKQELEDHLKRLEEAEKRDHRKLGKKMHLFHFQPEAPGMVFWHPAGWHIFKKIEMLIRTLLENEGYLEVHTPQMLDRSLWEKSGHWDKFSELMFTAVSENRTYAVKPMNCPAHVQIYNQSLKSYRDLPIRLSEFGVVHRNEHSGTLHGLMRARRFTQDDAHIFCTKAQIQSEVIRLIKLISHIYTIFGFEDVAIALSTRPKQRVGDDALWDQTEQALKTAIESVGLKYHIQPEEGAFYGPKIEFVLQDSIKRNWQCGTIQLDFSMPERLEAQFVDNDGSKKTVVLIHRAILGSIERFIGILIEHHAGMLPFWLAPTQLVILSITEKQTDYAQQIATKLTQNGIRVTCDLRNDTIGYRIREQAMMRIPYLIIVGDKELQNNTISVRDRTGNTSDKVVLDEFVEVLIKQNQFSLERTDV